ncbi:MAG: restriction endonuclease subunit S [Lachnospiraceae bacterium]|nr:restriction endonuclease subunit S [Lachnospiraceae bacterium]
MAHYKMSDVVIEVKDKESSPSTSKYERFVGLEHYVSGDVEISQYGKTDSLESTMKVFQAGDILVARRNVYLRRASRVSFDGLTSGDSIVLRANDKVMARILPFVLNTDAFWNYADQHSDGTMSKRLSPKLLLDYEFDLPDEGLEDFSDLLWAVNDTRNSYRQLLIKTDDMVKSQFIEMFGDLDSNTKGWKKEPLKKHADILVGYPFPSSGYSEKGIKIIGGYNLMQGYINWDDSKYWPTMENYEQYLLKDGDIVMAMDRPWTGDGFKMAFIDGTQLPALLIQRTACIRASDIENEFLYTLLNSQWFADHCNVKGSLVPHISNKDMNSFMIYIPPNELQKEFVRLYQQSDKSKFELNKAIEKTTNLMRDLMRQEFGK